MKRLIKVFSIALGLLLALVLLVPVLLYVPWVQDRSVVMLLRYLNDNQEDVRYDVRQLRLQFPLDVELWDLLLSRPSTGDTLAYVHHLQTALDDFPHGEQPCFVVNQLLVEELKTDIDTLLVPGLTLSGRLDTLRIREVAVCLDSNRVSVGDILLQRPSFNMPALSVSSSQDDEEAESGAPWNVQLGALDIILAQLGYDVWSVDSLDLHLTQLRLEDMNLGIDTLCLSLPSSHIGISSRIDLDNLSEATLDRTQAQFDLSLSGRDVLSITHAALPELATYCSDSLSLTLAGSLRQSLCQCHLKLGAGGAMQQLECFLSYHLHRHDYWTALFLSDFHLSDYLPSQTIDIPMLRLESQGNLDDSLTLRADISCGIPNVCAMDSLQVEFFNSPHRMMLDVRGGDAQVRAEAGCDVHRLMAVTDSVAHELDMQRNARIFDINALQRTIPELRVEASMHQQNPIMPLLSQYGVRFDALSFRLTNTDSLRMQVRVDTLVYGDIQIADVGARLVPNNANYDYQAQILYQDTITGKDFRLRAKARLLSDTIAVEGGLKADTMSVLTFQGDMSERLNAEIRLAELPLSLIQGFLPPEVQIQGALTGFARLDCDSIDFHALKAALWFNSASVWYEGCDMTLGLPQDSIVYHDGQLLFDNIRFRTSNNQPITLSGKIDLQEDVTNPYVDLIVKSDKACLFRNTSRRSRGQFLCGNLPLTTAISVLGTTDNLKVTGQVSVPAGCRLTYYYEEDEAVSQSSQLTDLVDFVPFDTVAAQASDSTVIVEVAPAVKASRLDLSIRLNIDPTTQITAHLPTSSDDHVIIRGGGNLKLSMDERGNLRLSGGYNVSGGDINFKLPMLPVTKQFALTDQSWLRWSGIVDQPELNLMATEDVKCTISDATAGARVTRFVVSVLISGTLENMNVVFDCTAPDDAALQSELASLTDEERTKQALMLLVAQTYTGPSAYNSSVGLSSANAALSNLLNKELESLLSGKLRHTEINVGIDSYDATGTGAQQTDYSVSVTQKFFHDRMRVTVGGKMSTGDETQQKENSIINDVSVEWLMKRDGSQYARLFRHTNFESVIEGEVVETGVGYVQKREAFRFKHLFIRSNRRRKEAREAMLKKLQEEDFLQNRH